MEKAKVGHLAADTKHEEMEKFATKLVSEWHGHLTKLKELAPSIKKVEEYFHTHVRGSVMLMGCSSFKEFCVNRLKRHRSVVYKMLQNYKRETEGEQDEHERNDKGGSSTNNRDQLKKDLADAKAKVERLLPVGHAAGKFANAVKEGNEALKAEAIKELLHTVDPNDNHVCPVKLGIEEFKPKYVEFTQERHERWEARRQEIRKSRESQRRKVVCSVCGEKMPEQEDAEQHWYAHEGRAEWEGDYALDGEPDGDLDGYDDEPEEHYCEGDDDGYDCD